MAEIFEITGMFLANLISSDVPRGTSSQQACLTHEVPAVRKYHAEKALKGMKADKAAGDDGKTVVLLKNGGDVVV